MNLPSKPLPFTPTNNLEQLQLEAATSIEKRSQFWEKLLNSDIYVVSEMVGEDGNIILHTLDGIGESACFSFTSLEKLIDAMPPETPYINLTARIIFQSMVQEGLGTFINPRYEPMVRIRVREIKLMLDGSFNEIVGSNT
jgi:hypothetical protein